jgi:hypothetical protein
MIDVTPQVSFEKNVNLTTPYLEEEVRKAVFQMEHKKMPESDYFPLFQLSFIKISGILSKMIYWSCLVNCMPDSLIFSAPNLKISFY